MNHVSPSVRRHLWHYCVRTRSRLSLMGYFFLLHMERTYIEAVRWRFIFETSQKIVFFANFRKIVNWGLSVIINRRFLYGRALGHSATDFIFLSYMD